MARKTKYFIDDEVLAFSDSDVVVERSKFYDFQWPQPLGIAGAIVLHMFFVVSIVLMKPIEKTPDTILGFDIITLPAQKKISPENIVAKYNPEDIVKKPETARDIMSPDEIKPIETPLAPPNVEQTIIPADKAPPPPILEQQKEAEKEPEDVPITPRTPISDKINERVMQNKLEIQQKPIESQLNNILKNTVIQKEEDNTQKLLEQKQIEAAKQQELMRQQENAKQQEIAKQQEQLRQQKAIEDANLLKKQSESLAKAQDKPSPQTNNAPKANGGELSAPSGSSANTSNIGNNGGVTAVNGGLANGGSASGNTGGNIGVLPRSPKTYGALAHKLEGTPNGSLLYKMGQTAQCNDLTRERDERCKDTGNHDGAPPVKVQVKPFPMPAPKQTGKDPLPPCPPGTPHSNFGLSCLPER